MIKQYISKRNLLILLLPFVIFCFEKSIIFPAIILLIVAFVFDLFLLKKIKSTITATFLISTLMTFFYSLILYNDTFYVIHQLRFRYFLLVFFPLMFLIYYYIEFSESHYVTNTILVIFSFTLISNFSFKINKLNEKKFIENLKYNNEYENITNSNNPLVFIILDELSSSSEIFKHTNDSKDTLILSNYRKNGFQIFDNFISKSMSTSFSLPSIFNFNLHDFEETCSIDGLSVIPNSTLKQYYNLFRNNILYDSLTKKGIRTNSYSLFKIFNSSYNGLKSQPWSPRNIREREFNIFDGYPQLNSLMNLTIVKFLYLKVHPDLHDEIYSSHNKETFEVLKKTEFKERNFYYFHFLAPHTPYYLKNEFDERKVDLNNFQNHINVYSEYRLYILDKLLNVLSNKESNARFIISGDHGFRSFHGKINPYSTLLITKGFNRKEINTNLTVQDLGYLINNSF